MPDTIEKRHFYDGGSARGDAEPTSPRRRVFEAGGRFLWKAAMSDVIEEIALKGGAFRVKDAAGREARFEARTGKAL